MKSITSSALQSLMEHSNGTALTIYLPTHRYPTPPNMREDQIRFKNSVRSAEEELKKAGTPDDEAKDIINRLEQKYEDIDFWRDATDGMVFFVNKEMMETYCLPFECDDRITVADYFDVGLALAACSYDQQYMLLALAVHEPKVFMGSMTELKQLAIDLPKSPEAALNIDEMFANSNTVRAVAAGGNASNRLSSHGQGDSREAGNEERLSYFRIIDHEIINSKAYDAKIPLLLAGIDSEIAEYRSISKHPYILQDFISGNHTSTPPQELRELAWMVIDKDITAKAHEGVLSRFNEVMGAGKSSTDVRDIYEAAIAGRIDTLLVAAITATHDTVSDKAAAIRKLVSPEWYGQLKIDEIVRKVVEQGGKVIGFDVAKLPRGAEVAAIYRY